jgi:hypothetical protein
MVNPDGSPMFMKNKHYQIYNEIDDNIFIVISEIDRKIVFDNNEDGDNHWYIYDYFYTEEEIRKFKLNSLNHV